MNENCFALPCESNAYHTKHTCSLYLKVVFLNELTVGPVTVVPQACSELAVTAHPTTSRPTGTPFYYEPQCAFVDEIRSTYSIEQSTKISQQEEIEIAIAPFYVSREYGIIHAM